MECGEGTRIQMHYTLYLFNGQEVDSTYGEDDPHQFTWDDGSLLPNLQKCLKGLNAGEKREWRLNPEDGFGAHQGHLVQKVDRKQFQLDEEPEVGLILSFSTESGAEIPGMIVECSDEAITIDLNHPLAGQSLLFKVEILAVHAA